MTAESQSETRDTEMHGRVAKNAVIYFAGQIISWLITFVSVSLIPRRLGEFASGEMMVAGSTINTVSQIMMLGMESYLVKEIGRDRSQTEKLLRAVFGLRLVLIPLNAIICVAILAFMNPTRMIWVLCIFGLFNIPLTFFNAPLRAALSGREEARRVSLLDIVSAASPLAAVPFLAYGGPIALSIVALVMGTCSLVLYAWWLRDSGRFSPLFDRVLWGQITRNSIPFFINSMILYLYGFSAVFLLQKMTDVASVGVYSQANRLFGTFLFVPTAIGSALLPALSRLVDVSQQEFRVLQSRVFALLIVLGLPVTVSVMLLAKPLSLMLYGPTKFVTMPQILPYYALAIIPMYIVATMYQFLVAQNRNAVWVYFLASTVVIFLLLGVGLIPLTQRYLHNGVIGAVLATFIAESLSAVFAFMLLKTNPFTAETTGRLLRALLATAGMAGVLVATQNITGILPASLQVAGGVLFVALALRSVLGIAVFAVLCWVFHVLLPEEQSKLVEMVRRKLGRR